MPAEYRKVVSMPQPERPAESPLPVRTPPSNPAWLEFEMPDATPPAGLSEQADSQLQRALNALHAGQIVEAIECLEACLAGHPASPDAIFYLACAEQRRGDLERARHWYLQSIHASPLAWQPLFNLALVAIAEHQAAEARGLLERAALLGPEVAEVRWQLALLCEQAGDEIEARHWYESVLMLDPEHSGARFRIGLIALRSGDLQLATVHLEACQSGHPNAALAAYHLGLCHFHAARWKDAHNAFERARQAAPQTPEFLLALAALALAENDLERAERHERELHELGALPAELSFNLARAWQERGQPERARRHYKLAVDRNPSLALGYFR